MARALIVGCGCRGRELARELIAAGWRVRGTTRTAAGAPAIEREGAEAALADPGRIATVVDRLEGVALVYWLLGSAEGPPGSVSALHGPRLERLLEEIVDTPVRGLIYEAAGSVPAPVLAGGAEAVRAAGERWRIPYELVSADPAEIGAWREEMVAAGQRLLSGRAHRGG